MLRLLVIAVLHLLLRPVLAIFEDEAWNIDYHYALIGEPQHETTFFHRPSPESRASLIYTLSDKAVLGAVNPRDGSIVWRQLLAGNHSRSDAVFLRAGEDQDVLVSGVASRVAAWSAADGRLAWDASVLGQLKDIEILELQDGKETKAGKDAIVLSGGEQTIVQRLDGITGAVKWVQQIDGGDTPCQISASTTDVFVIMLHKTILGYIKIRVLKLDPVDGHKTDEYTLSSETELATADTIVSVGSNSASPIIAWTDASHSVLKVNIIGTKNIASFNIDKLDEETVEQVRLHAPHHSNSLAHFLVHYESAKSHWADVFHIDQKKNKITKAYSLPKIAGRGAFATSTSDANVYFTRITSGDIMTVSSASHGILGRWPVDGFGVTATPGEALGPIRAVSELSIKADTVSAIRTAVLLSTGEWVLLREGKPVWQRPEVLAGTTSATFALPAAVEDLAQKLDVEAQSSPISAYVHRITRHIDDLKSLPLALAALPQRVLGSSADGGVGSDSFGFHKIIACLTENDRIVALDAGTSHKILWSRKVSGDAVAGKAFIGSLPNGVLVLDSESATHKQFFNASNGYPLTDIMSPQLVKYTSNVESGTNVQYGLQDGKLTASIVDGKPTELWHFTPTEGERILSIVPRPVNDPVASIGKVLGDRRVLYKYLNPNLALLVTANDASKTAIFYVLDTISGAVLYSRVHNGVDINDPIASTMSENWFVYSFTTEVSEYSPKGHALVVGEMFESLAANDRGPLSASTNFSAIHTGTEPFTLVQTYQISEAISKMTVTQTGQGITSRQVLAVLSDSNAIVGIPYWSLDPRRPVDRDPTKDEQAEGLIRYSPAIEFDPKWYLNHQRDVLGIQEIITSPALIESTSIVFAHGLDIFGTRLSPSFSFDILGKDFNKVQMLATVAALGVATLVVAPLVMRKGVNARWQFA